MSVDERHRRLHRKLEAILGSEEAQTLIDDLAPRGVSPEDLRRELALLEARMDTKLATLESRLLDRLNDQTKTLFRTFVVSNAAMVLAVGTLAFGAARLA